MRQHLLLAWSARPLLALRSAGLTPNYESPFQGKGMRLQVNQFLPPLRKKIGAAIACKFDALDRRVS